MTQPTLFDPKTAERPPCPACGTQAKNLCRFDADVAHQIIEPLARRPKGCLVSAQLGPDDPLPF